MGDSEAIQATIVEILEYGRNQQRNLPKLSRVEERFDSIASQDYPAALRRCGNISTQSN
jgi:hypothetical protein